MEQSEENSDLISISKHLVSTLVPSVAKSVKLSHEFPMIATPAFTYYNDFPQYKAVMNGNSNKILSLIQHIIDEVHGEGNVVDVPQPKSLEEKFAAIVDVNDRVFDRVSLEMDHEENPNRTNNNSQDLVVATQDNFQSSSRAHKENFDISDKRKSQMASSNSSLKLLAAKNIGRPQVFFTRPPDNSSTPFSPNLKVKPNAILPLEKCNQIADLNTGDYDHPYFTELEELAKTYQHFTYTPSKNPKPVALSDTELQFIDSKTDLLMMMAELKAEPEIAVDLEHHNYRSFLGITCLMQLSSRKKDYIVDTIALRDDLASLNEIFTDPNIVKVFHGSDCDLMWLQRDCGCYIVNLFDTGQAARALHLPRFSLGYLLQVFANITVNKKYQLADWRIRPLPKELIEYARSDTHFLLYVAEQLRGHLFDRGLLKSVMETNREMCLRLYKKPVFDPLGYLDIYRKTGGYNSNKRQLYALKRLYALRDSIARREDESVQFVLPNHMMKVIAEELPRESSGVFACCSPIPPMVRKYVYDIHRIIMEARNNKLSDLTVDDIAYELGKENAKLESTAYTLRSIRAPPHDFSIGHSSRTGPFGSASFQGAENSSYNTPSPMCRSFGRPTNTCEKPNSKYVDPNRVMLHKLLGMIKTIPVSDPAPAVDEDAIQSSSVNVGEDPLYCPPPKTEEFSRSLTAEEVIQVAELGETFHPSGVPALAAHSSAQSRVANQLKSRRLEQSSGDLSSRRRSWKDKKHAKRESEVKPAVKPEPVASDESDEMEVVICREPKLRNPPREKLEQHGGNSPFHSPNLTKNQPDAPSTLSTSSPQQNVAQSSMAAAVTLPPIKKKTGSNNRRRRTRVRGNGNRRSFPGNQSK